MENKEFGKGLEMRTKKFAINIIRLSGLLPSTIEVKVIRHQITKSASSVGANYREANRARSRSDFYNKIRICQSESSETSFWLEIIFDLDLKPQNEIECLIEESNELLAIFTSIARNLNR